MNNINSSNATIQTDNSVIKGSNNKIIGNDNVIRGSNNKIIGDRNKLRGSNNTSKGCGNVSLGSNNKVKNTCKPDYDPKDVAFIPEFRKFIASGTYGAGKKTIYKDGGLVHKEREEIFKTLYEPETYDEKDFVPGTFDFEYQNSNWKSIVDALAGGLSMLVQLAKWIFSGIVELIFNLPVWLIVGCILLILIPKTITAIVALLIFIILLSLID